MSRLMPGRIRQEGISLYETGKLQVENVKNQTVTLNIDGHQFAYGLQDEQIHCDCDLFATRGYCPHLAATEYFLKNAAEGKKIDQKLRTEEEFEETVEQSVYEGGKFLDKLIPSGETSELRYQLSVEGQLLPFDQNIEWTLRLSRLPDGRSYIVRDIAAFLRVVRHNDYYQIGKNYYEQLFARQFDEASQDVLHFLWTIVPEKASLDSDVVTNMGRHLRLPSYCFEEGLALFQDLNQFSLEVNGLELREVHTLPLTVAANLFQFAVTVHTHFIELEMTARPVRSLLNGRFLLDQQTFYAVDEHQQALLASLASMQADADGRKTVQVDFQDKDKLALSLMELDSIGRVQAPAGLQIRDFKPAFSVDVKGKMGLDLRLTLDFDGVVVRSETELENLPFTSHYQHLQLIERTIHAAGFTGLFHATRASLTADERYRFFSQDLPRLEELGQVTLSEAVQSVYVAEEPKIVVSMSGNLLDVQFDFSGIDEEEISQAVQSLLDDQDYYTSKDGRLVLFDEETKRISQSLQDLRAQFSTDGHLQLDRFASYRLAETLGTHHNVQFSQQFQQLAYDLAHPEEFPLEMGTVKATLREYQENGVRWLSMLDSYRFGGILADDMGLGKTLQTIAFLSGKIEQGAKVLILAPSSLIYNWQEEFKKFAPNVDTAVIYGTKEYRLELLEKGASVAITSYASFRQDVEAYNQVNFDYLILDEAQVMKNAHTKIAQYLREFEVGNCFALSGTPIENRLTEIWSIFQIVLPGLLPNKREFGKLSPQEVARLIRPFVLRRKKEDVLVELPELIEVNVQNELHESQKVLYLAQLRQMQESIQGASDSEINQKKIEILSGITRLRQICDTPKLFMENYFGGSGKLDSLRELLEQLQEGGHRILIFSQFRNMLDVVEKELTGMGMSHYMLTGSTPADERQAMTRAFNTGSRDAFLISLKAGGVGLNLTGADTVILVDLWWNPAVEAQAISRAHRMGQKETVEVYRMITRGTIEEKIQELQESKKNLVTTVLDGNESRASMTVEDIREILGIS